MSFFKQIIFICFVVSLFLTHVSHKSSRLVAGSFSAGENHRPVETASQPSHICDGNSFEVSERELEIGEIPVGPPLGLEDGTLIFSSGGSSLFFFSREGVLTTTFEGGAKIISTPIVLHDGTIVVGAMNGLVYFLSFDGASVTLKGQHQAENSVYASPVVLSDGTIVVGSMYGSIDFLSFDGENITFMARSYATLGSVLGLGVMADDTVVATAADNKIYFIQFNTIDNSTFLRADHEIDSMSFFPPAILDDGAVLVASTDGLLSLFGFDSNGSLELRDQSSLRWPIHSAPRVLGGDTILIGSEKRVYFLSVNSRDRLRVRSSFRGRGVIQPFGSPVVSDETVVVGNNKGDLYFIDLYGDIKAHLRERRSVFIFPTAFPDGTVAAISRQKRQKVNGRIKKVHFLEPICN